MGSITIETRHIVLRRNTYLLAIRYLTVRLFTFWGCILASLRGHTCGHYIYILISNVGCRKCRHDICRSCPGAPASRNTSHLQAYVRQLRQDWRSMFTNKNVGIVNSCFKILRGRNMFSERFKWGEMSRNFKLPWVELVS